MNFFQLKPTELASLKHFTKVNGKFIPFEGETGFMSQNYNEKIFRGVVKNGKNKDKKILN